MCAGVPRLFDLVKCSDAALRPAFFFALGDTVVAHDLEQASRIAYGREKRWARVVTMQVQAWNQPNLFVILGVLASWMIRQPALLARQLDP